MSIYSGLIDINVVFGGDAAVSSANISLAFDNSTCGQFMVVDVLNGTASLKNVLVPNATIWSLAQPNLHTLTVYFSQGRLPNLILMIKCT